MRVRAETTYFKRDLKNQKNNRKKLSRTTKQKNAVFLPVSSHVHFEIDQNESGAGRQKRDQQQREAVESVYRRLGEPVVRQPLLEHDRRRERGRHAPHRAYDWTVKTGIFVTPKWKKKNTREKLNNKI